MMKLKLPIGIVSILTLVLFFVISCKEPVVIVDYRYPYVGEYSFTYHFTDIEYNLNDTIYIDTIVNYNGNVSFGEEGEIYIDWYNGFSPNFEVSNGGNLRICNEDVGLASDNSIIIEMDGFVRPICSGGQYSMTKVTGVKQ